MGIRRAAAAAFAMAMLLVACSSASESGAAGTEPATPTPALEPVDGLTATIVQYTRDRPARVVQVKIANTSDETIDVTLVEPRLQGFDAAQPPDQTSHLTPDRRVDFPVAIGEPSCDGQTEADSEIVVDATTGDGASRRGRVPIDDEDGLIPRVHKLDCDVQRVEETVDITVADTWRQVGEGADAAVVGHVAMELRPDGGSARVADLDAGLLLRVVSGRPGRDGANDATYVVDADQPNTGWDVELVGARCDGHAIAESRRLMALTFRVSVDGGEPVPLRRQPTVDGYNTMVAALLERCESRSQPEG
jgi:hypothetical protein